MSSVYFPVQVVVILRRLVNIISTISISSHYLASSQRRNEHRENGPQSSKQTASVLSSLKSLEPSNTTWPWYMGKDGWKWPQTYLNGTISADSQRRIIRRSLSSHIVDVDRNHERTQQVEPERGNEIAPVPQPPDTHPPGKKGPKRTPQSPQSSDTIHQLLQNPALYDPLRTPRYPIVLCHGLYGFDTRGPSSFPSMRMHYWANVLQILRQSVKAEVIITSVPGTGSIASRAQTLNQQLREKAYGRGVNFLAHSMGGLDCRYLISHVRPSQYNPLSLTTISTPHRGSPFMDWCAENIGIGKLAKEEKKALVDAAKKKVQQEESREKESSTTDSLFNLSLSSLPSSFTTLLLSILDSPAYANLTSTYLNNVFNPATPDDPRVKYFSVAGRMHSVNVWHPFWLPKTVTDGAEAKERNAMKAKWESEDATKSRSKTSASSRSSIPLWANDDEWGNDGLVTIQSSKWGEFLGVMEGCDHWEMRGARGIEFGVDLPAIPAIGLKPSTLIGGSKKEDKEDEDRWNWLVNLWRKEEKSQVRAGRSSGHGDSHTASGAPPPPASPKQERDARRSKDDDVIKASTEKLSAVFDWLVDQVPAPSMLGSKPKVSLGEEPAEENGRETRKRELEAKEDLERFYVALSRKLYDEGL